MELSYPGTRLNSVLCIDRIERWYVYSRLQQLAVPCSCKIGQSLQVEVETAGSAIQLWCVIQQVTAPRPVLVNRLERCWQKSAKSSAIK